MYGSTELGLFFNPYLNYLRLYLQVTKGFIQTFKGNIAILVFYIFCQILFLSNDSSVHRSICLIEPVPLIPILP